MIYGGTIDDDDDDGTDDGGCVNNLLIDHCLSGVRSFTVGHRTNSNFLMFNRITIFCTI